MFLYNFFHDSECDESQWRVVLNGIDLAHATGIPAFDDIKHIGICSEVFLFFSSGCRRVAQYSLPAEVSLCCHYEGTKQPAYCGLFDQRGIHEGVPFAFIIFFFRLKCL